MTEVRNIKFAQDKNTSKLMRGAEPIFLEGGDAGIVFFHGFTGSPYEGRDFATYFGQKGYTVWVPLLPGHGTHPGELMKISWQDWYSFSENCFLEMKKKCQTVILSGQSMGGSLALSLAAHYPADAVISLAGAVFLKDWRLKFLPIARRFLHYQYKSKGPDISLKEVRKNSASYRKYPIRSIDELLNLLNFTRGNLTKVKDPVLLIHSQNDHTVTFQNMDFIYTQVSSAIKKKYALKNSYHIISLDRDKTKVLEIVENFLEELDLTS